MAAPVGAQQALATTEVRSGVPSALLTLRPEADLRALAVEVADVLELRTGERVEVGDAPPPGLLQAVPAGHMALARRGSTVLLVIGGAGGRSFDASVTLTATKSTAADARALALAAETLRDTATELARKDELDLDFEGLATSEEAASENAAPEAQSAMPKRDDGSAASVPSRGLLGEVDPLVYVRMYSGASSASSAPMLGVATALGVCVQRHCLFLAGEMPIDVGATGTDDLRYRYLTFVSGFYSRPFSFDAFTPGASLGFFTRLGHFEEDMGLGDHGLGTDLGARGSVELAWEFLPGADLMAEGGADVTIDRQYVASGSGMITRGDRVSPWMQGALRYRP